MSRVDGSGSASRQRRVIRQVLHASRAAIDGVDSASRADEAFDGCLDELCMLLIDPLCNLHRQGPCCGRAIQYGDEYIREIPALDLADARGGG